MKPTIPLETRKARDDRLRQAQRHTHARSETQGDRETRWRHAQHGIGRRTDPSDR